MSMLRKHLYTVLSPSGGAAAVDWWDPDGSIGAANVAGVWQAKGVASLAASYLRLAGDQGYANIDPAVVGSGVAPTWDAVNGWTFVPASSQWLNTGIIVPNGTWSALVQYNNAGLVADQILFGSSSSATTTFGASQRLSGKAYYWNGGGINIAANRSSGNMAIAAQQGYYNGVAEGGATPAWVGVGIHVLAIGVLNNGGINMFYLGANIESIAIYKTTLTAPQVALLSAAMAAL